MKRILFAALVALALPGCAALEASRYVPPSPGVIAGQTVLDERAALSVELAYKAFRTALEIAVDAGALKGTAASKAAALDNRAFAAVGAVRAAYRAGNAASYVAAVDEARAGIAAALAAVRP